MFVSVSKRGEDEISCSLDPKKTSNCESARKYCSISGLQTFRPLWSESERDMGEKRNQILQQTGNPFFEKIEKSEFTTEEICVLPLWELLARFVRHWGLPFTFLIPS